MSAARVRACACAMVRALSGVRMVRACAWCASVRGHVVGARMVCVCVYLCVCGRARVGCVCARMMCVSRRGARVRVQEVRTITGGKKAFNKIRSFRSHYLKELDRYTRVCGRASTHARTHAHALALAHAHAPTHTHVHVRV